MTPEQQEIQNLEVRLRKLEQLHLWGLGITLLFGVAYFLFKKK